ncbi:efflux RND transporter permease subunit [Clavibacter nebraskensis]|uniref:Integral membrane efflux transporter, RND family n=4 Tax=Clavibacter nebraskensis TaxID=31963 RepID=A0AAI8ZGU8_9MICO|nr:efflux RND transporter permease subunit [Clavibacter nebraskensis]KXU21528.1 hydrogenase expression protein [Clavibacter nebraskensis]OAH19236.1 hydrogenase expression protein [Clavibacter nebraskensis]QGV68026.1 efflux RND transporter permease subunit [Clavibacter nebraskensis]QGV70823.1 efflux RND transporter permease subunit [Clavibacter nebraskensis]QGV73616.1 efflux RND transporter permease subunit [Clavibacter nebraskensis]
MHLLSVFSLRNRALIALITIVIGVFGGIALTTLKQELIPSVTFPQLAVVTAYPGASPAVVDSDVSTPIERAIQAVPGLESSTATSRTDSSVISASFTYGTDLATAEQKIDQAINRIRTTLPDGIDPVVIAGSIDDLPVIQIAVTSDLSPQDLTAALERSTLADIRKLEGVRDASLLGTVGQRVVITPDPAKVQAEGLTNQAIRDALDANGSLLPAGSVTEDGTTLSVQSGTRLGSTQDLASLPLLGAAGGRAVTIGDVATVELGQDPTTGISRVDGQPSLTIAVTKTPAGNTVDVSHLVTQLLPQLSDDLGSNTKFTVVFDQAPFIEQSISSLTTEGLLGLVFAVLVILVFLMSIRSTIVTAISIPASVLITFIGMLASGYTLNIITLGALTIAVGRVVDDSIVVIENIKRHLSFTPDRLEAIRAAVREVAGAVTASTATTVAVFLPIALVGDITGELFRPFALTVTIALAASLFVALTIVPVLAYWFLRPEGESRRARKKAAAAETTRTGAHAAVRGSVDDRARSGRRARGSHAGDGQGEGQSGSEGIGAPTRLQRGYRPILAWTLKHSAVTLVLAILVLGGTVALIPSMKTNFLGDSGQNTLTVSQELPSDTSLEAQDTAATKVEQALIGVAGVETVQTSIGADSTSLTSAFGGGGGITFALTTDPDADQDAIREGVRSAVDGLTDVGDVSLAAASGGFSSSDIEVQITANDADDLKTSADAILAAVKDVPSIEQATSNLSETQPYIAVTVDRAKAAAAGLSEQAVGGIVTASRLPAAVGQVVIDEKTLSIYIQDPDAAQSLQGLRDFRIPTARGLVPLSDLATVEVTDGPATVTTTGGFRSATVSATPGSDDVGFASSEVSQAVADVQLPAGAQASLGGVASQQSNAFGQLGLAVLAAILIVYIIMVATFRSLIQPLVLLVSVPFAATGAVLLQVVTGIPLGVASIIGLLMLVGIVVTNAIVLIDLVNQYRTRGMGLREAILQGAGRRLRPILMTALATIFALLPLAIGLTGHGGFISQPLAIVVIGGLLSSTVLTLLVLPSLYSLVERAALRIRARGERRRAERGLPAGGSATTTEAGTAG